MEADPGDRARLDAIFRFVHTVKGSCGFLDLPRLARLSHAAEDALATVRDGRRTPDTALVDAVLAIVDRIGDIVEAIDGGRSAGRYGRGPADRGAGGGCAAGRGGSGSAQPRVGSRSVRLNVDLLDRMMSGMSDMVLARNELARRLRDVDNDPWSRRRWSLSLTVADMRDTVTRTRMQRIDALFSALPRMVRDTAGELGKLVALTIEGADVELDREMIELMRDPLLHIIRNAVDMVSRRRRIAARGQARHRRLIVSARQSGNQILVEITDDGRGIDVDRLVEKAKAQKILTASQAAAMDHAASSTSSSTPACRAAIR